MENLQLEKKSLVPHIIIEKQGKHSAKVPDRLDTTFADILRHIAEHTAETVLDADKEKLKCIESFTLALTASLGKDRTDITAWVIQVKMAVRGNSHFLEGTMRGYGVTDHNTLEAVIQPGDGASRRRCHIVAPSILTAKERRQCLEHINAMLRPCIHKPEDGMSFQVQKITKNLENSRKLSGTKERAPFNKALQFMERFSSSRSVKRNFAILMGDAIHSSQSGFIDVSEALGLVRKFWNSTTPTTLHGMNEAFHFGLIALACNELEMLAEEVDGQFTLGEFGELLYGDVLEERAEVARKQSERERSKLVAELEKLEIEEQCVQKRMQEIMERRGAIQLQLAETSEDAL